MADTCGTLVKAAAVLKENGAKSVLALVTHGILSGNAIETLNSSVLQALVVTNTVPLGDKVERVSLPDTTRFKSAGGWLTSQ
jgi:ribose-phosphate pyrophosphokinase